MFRRPPPLQVRRRCADRHLLAADATAHQPGAARSLSYSHRQIVSLLDEIHRTIGQGHCQFEFFVL